MGLASLSGIATSVVSELLGSEETSVLKTTLKVVYTPPEDSTEEETEEEDDSLSLSDLSVSSLVESAVEAVADWLGIETDISDDINADLISFTYTDNCDDEADEIRFTLKDDEGKWCDSWRPDQGAKISATISTSDGSQLEISSMMVDQQRFSGGSQGRTMEFTAVSIPLDISIRRLRRTKSYETQTLEQIADNIAMFHGLQLYFESDINPTYDRVDQKQQTDADFLLKLCHDLGLSVKITEETLVVYDQASFEKKDATVSYERTGGKVLSYSFSGSQSQRYKSCTVTWRDIRKKTRKATAETKEEFIEYTYTDESVEDSGQEYTFRHRCTSLAEAQRLAKAKLRELNLHQTEGSLSVVGNPLVYAGCVLELSDFGAADGKFLVERATHSITSGGYVTSLELRKINESY